MTYTSIWIVELFHRRIVETGFKKKKLGLKEGGGINWVQVGFLGLIGFLGLKKKLGWIVAWLYFDGSNWIHWFLND